ncbi:DUF2066 domain-containing protein [Rheinheimera sp. MMS21-TC3]|uniref:DUF2066 domain-containing protein n=1 Tax=Rheinheimera sp. MMS21-TC3 TaxID=3072790 RepID=UPI0028C3A69C|nr:DUF2066 domain-containing protein [Rheinheimera sp. MMS21-TC3]WNO60807.1 DUF2066 domain-containing protein [Rheinheimera sp. MMS21-TC3]
MIKLMKTNGLWLGLMLFFCSYSSVANAAKVENLYQADVRSSASNWQQLALEQVLIRVSGRADVAEHPVIKAEFNQVSPYIKQFTSVRLNDENLTRVVLDATRVNRLLQQADVAIWGELRPDTLIWLVEQNSGQREFITDANNELIKQLSSAFKQAGLPFMLPLYDMDDLINISVSDVWAGFWQQINQASARYNTDVTVATTIDKVTEGNNLLWRLTWQRQYEGRIIREQVTAENEAVLMQSFAKSLAKQLAGQYASVLSVQSSNNVIIEVENLTSLTDLVTVQQLLQQVVGVAQVTITSFSDDKARYSLQTAIASEGLLNALQFNKQFKLQTAEITELAIDSRVMPALATFRYLRL